VRYNQRVPEAVGKQDYSRKEVLRVVGLTERQLRVWERRGLIRPAAIYRFQDLVALRTLARLRSSGISTPRVEKALNSLRMKMRESGDPLREFRIYAEGKKIRVQVGVQKMEPESGQLLLNFDSREMRRLVTLSRPSARESAQSSRKRRSEAEYWFQLGVSLEQAGGQADKALEAYELAVALDPEMAAALLNMGTIHFTTRSYERAEKYYRKALEVKPDYPLAHFNMGNLCDEKGDKAAALLYYLNALRLQPDYADAHYNIALVYQGLGQVMKAVRHWKAYLKLDPNSQWAEIARRELRKLYASTVVQGTAHPDNGAKSS
jgi:tetratricopeptide (TPR) repeat protein